MPLRRPNRFASALPSHSPLAYLVAVAALACSATGCAAESPAAQEADTAESPLLTNAGTATRLPGRSVFDTILLDPGRFRLFFPAERYNAYLDDGPACADTPVLGGTWRASPTFGTATPFCTFVWRELGVPANVGGLQAALGASVVLTRDTCAETNCADGIAPRAVLRSGHGEGQVACTSCTPVGYVAKNVAYVSLPADLASRVAGSVSLSGIFNGRPVGLDISGVPAGAQTFSVKFERQIPGQEAYFPLYVNLVGAGTEAPVE